jgi:hypothetical protein
MHVVINIIAWARKAVAFTSFVRAVIGRIIERDAAPGSLRHLIRVPALAGVSTKDAATCSAEREGQGDL